MTNLVVYGAGGYTGRIITEYAKNTRLLIKLAGRNESKIQHLADESGFPYVIFGLDEPSVLDSSLKDVKVLLNCAGPFARTARPLIDACVRNGVHYLDVSAELGSYDAANDWDEAARQSNVMLLPGCGGSVAMLGCLAGHAITGLGNPTSIAVALHVSGSMSRGSATSAASTGDVGSLHRIDGQLVPQEFHDTRKFNFEDGNGDVDCFPVTLPDLITIAKSTGVNTIRTYAFASGSAFPRSDIAAMPDGPSAEERQRNPYHAVATVTGEGGETKTSVLHTVNGYTFTAIASLEAAKRILAGTTASGFQTPAGVFGDSFALSVPGTVIEDL